MQRGDKLPIRKALLGNVICTGISFMLITILICLMRVAIFSTDRMQNPTTNILCDDSNTKYYHVSIITHFPETNKSEIMFEISHNKYITQTVDTNIITKHNISPGISIYVYTSCSFPYNSTLHFTRQYVQNNIMMYQIVLYYCAMLASILIMILPCTLSFAMCYICAIADHYLF